jgi:hypothetical protein
VAREAEHEVEREPAEAVCARERERLGGALLVVDAAQHGQFLRHERLRAHGQAIHTRGGPRVQQPGLHRLGIGLERDLGAGVQLEVVAQCGPAREKWRGDAGRARRRRRPSGTTPPRLAARSVASGEGGEPALDPAPERRSLEK